MGVSLRNKKTVLTYAGRVIKYNVVNINNIIEHMAAITSFGAGAVGPPAMYPGHESHFSFNITYSRSHTAHNGDESLCPIRHRSVILLPPRHVFSNTHLYNG